MKMQFINGGHRSQPIKQPNAQPNNAQPNNAQPNNAQPNNVINIMSAAKRQSISSRFNMNKNMRTKKTGCGSCSGVR